MSLWFANSQELWKKSMDIVRDVSTEEERHLFGKRALFSIEVILWIMEEAKSADSLHMEKWTVLCSRIQNSLGPEEDAVTLMMALSTSGTREIPIEIEDDEIKVWWKMEAREVMYTSWHSPRSPCHSARSRSLSCSVVSE